MNYKFFFLDSETAKNDPTTVGYKYAMLKQSEWVDGPSGLNGNLTTGVAKGIDNVIYDNKAYQIIKIYFDIANNTILVICVESVVGCDVKENFNI